MSIESPTAETNAPAVPRPRLPQRCYECDGSTWITVSMWTEATNDYIDVSSTCVRCKGTGRITDGPTTRGVLRFPASWAYGPECICNYTIDGPMGHPRCPAR